MAGFTYEKQVSGATRTLVLNGFVYTIRLNPNKSENQDAWIYDLPDGRYYTHPTEAGCYHFILKDLAERSN